MGNAPPKYLQIQNEPNCDVSKRNHKKIQTYLAMYIDPRFEFILGRIFLENILAPNQHYNIWL